MSESERTEVLVVGGGQAGLIAGYNLRQAGLPFVILEANSAVGESWRRRWDSLTLFTVARYSALPGLTFPGDPNHWPGKDEVADYLEQYAKTFDLPVRCDSRVTSLEATDGGYRVETSTGSYQARQVIVATGAYQRPRLPSLAGELDDGVVQVHSADYRNPGQLPSGTVVVVGAANSGAGIAEDLAASHRVVLSQGSRIGHLPRRLLGKPLHFWGDKLGLIAASLNSWRGRTQRGEVLVGPSLRRLSRRHDIELVGRAVGAAGRTLQYDDGSQTDADAIVWATGYRPDYAWINVPGLLDENAKPVHRRGITAASGLYFVGMKEQYSRGSSLIYWVKDDAEYIVDQVRTSRERSEPRS